MGRGTDARSLPAAVSAASYAARSSEQLGHARGRARHPGVRELGGAPDGHADPSRRSRWAARRVGHRLDAARGPCRTGRRGPPLTAPQRPEDRDELFQLSAATVELGVVERELVGPIADGRAQDQPVARERLDDRDVLGQAHRVIEGRDDDIGAQQDPLVRAPNAASTTSGDGQ